MTASSRDMRQNGTFAGGIGELWCGCPEQGDEGCRVDDAAAAGPLQSRDAVFATEEDAFHIDLHGEIPDGFAGVDGVIVIGVADAGVVEEDVELAVARFSGGDHRFAICGERHIRANISRGSAARDDLSDTGFAAGVVDIDDDHGRALRREALRGLVADAAAGAGDEGYFVFESHVESPFSDAGSPFGVPMRTSRRISATHTKASRA